MAAAAPDRLFIIVKAPNGDVREVAVGSTRIVVGRDESADIRVEDRKVSRRHAAFVAENGLLYAEDLGSSNGIRLNGQRVNRRAVVSATDVVLVGGYEVRLKPGGVRARPSIPMDATETRPVGSSPPTVGLTRDEVKKVRSRSASVAQDRPILVGLDRITEGRRFVLDIGENIVGRQEDSTVSVLDGSISRQHARLDVRDNGVFVSDLESANGVFINGVRLDKEMLASGDQLRFGSVNFRVELPTTVPNRLRAPGRRAGGKDGAKKQRKSASRWPVFAALVMLASLAGLGFEVWRRHQETEARRRLALAVPVTADAGPSTATDSGTTEDAGGPTATVPSFATARTATSPFGRRDESGLPVDLPEVDASFDFDGFVSARLKEAEGFEKDGRYLDVRRALFELSRRDPVNADARAMLERIRLAEETTVILEKVDLLRQKGELMAAYDALLAVSPNAPQAGQVSAIVTDLRPLAFKSELDRAAREAANRKSYPAAHQRLVAVLERDPTNAEALRLIASLETAMLDKKVRFEAYVPPTAPKDLVPGTADPAVLLAARYSDRVLVRVLETYLAGKLDQALESARGLARRSKGARQKEAQSFARSFESAKTKYQRTRTALGNDPGEAWAHLIELETIERSILPAPLNSKLVVELKQGIAEEYARRGDAYFTQSRFEDSFQQWISATKLQPKNGRALAGLARLEKVAEKEAPEIDLSAQMGAKDACDRWRRLTRMTRAESEVYKRAAQRVKVACSK